MARPAGMEDLAFVYSIKIPGTSTEAQIPFHVSEPKLSTKASKSDGYRIRLVNVSTSLSSRAEGIDPQRLAVGVPKLLDRLNPMDILNSLRLS